MFWLHRESAATLIVQVVIYSCGIFLFVSTCPFSHSKPYMLFPDDGVTSS